MTRLSSAIEGSKERWATATQAGRGFEMGDYGPGVIVVGLDADQLNDDRPGPSLDAVAYAAGLARRLGARLVPVWVRTPISLSDTFVETMPTLVAERDERITEVRRRLDDALESFGVTPISLVIRDGDPFDELTSVASELHADAVVVGASEHRLGSLAVRLVRDARWPVTVVP